MVANQDILKYNKSNETAWDVRHPTFLNLHLLLWDSYIRRQMSGHQYLLVREQWKAETDVRLPTWLRLGVKNVGNGILGHHERAYKVRRRWMRNLGRSIYARKRTSTKDNRRSTKEDRRIPRKEAALQYKQLLFLRKTKRRAVCPKAQFF